MRRWRSRCAPPARRPSLRHDVIAALLCRTLADVNGTSGLGPIGALGIAVAMLAMLTLLPAWARDLRSHRLLAARARVRHEGTDELHGVWRRVGDRVAQRPPRVWVGTVALLLVLGARLLNIDHGLTSGNGFRDDVEAVAGQELLAQASRSGSKAPTDVIVPRPGTRGGDARRGRRRAPRPRRAAGQAQLRRRAAGRCRS